jgi:hypothetical protein
MPQRSIDRRGKRNTIQSLKASTGPRDMQNKRQSLSSSTGQPDRLDMIPNPQHLNIDQPDMLDMMSNLQ